MPTDTSKLPSKKTRASAQETTLIHP